MTLKSKLPVQPLSGIESLDDVARRYLAEQPPDVYRAKWTQAAREAYYKEHPENFAGPDMTYPIKDSSDVGDAWGLAGHADNPDAVRSKIKAIAKHLGLTGSLPDTAKDKATSERAARPDDHLEDILDNPDEEDADEDEHALMEALESITDEEEDDDGEKEEDEEHRAPGATFTRTDLSTDILCYAPITRINKKKREIIGVAAAERKDAYRTVIGYEASKQAFDAWRGNIREMHDPKKAVGRALEIRPDDKNKRIIVRAMISKGAEDTWQKVLDKTLTGFSIGGKNGVWTTRTVDGEELPYLERYDAAELSLVDNPACPGCNIEIVRSDGLASAILAKDDEMEPKISVEAADLDRIDRAGARLSKETQEAMHMARDHAKNAMASTCKTCGCDECNDHMDALMEISKRDDNDVDANYLAPASMASMRRLVGDIVRDAVVPLFQEHSTLLSALNVYTLVVVPDSEKYAYLALQGITYRVHLFEIQVSQQYTLQGGVID